MWPIFVPFQGVMLCKNGPNLLKINIYCTFWPNNVWKLFCIKLFYKIFLVYQIFNILNFRCALCDQFLSPFRGSCCVKMAKSYSKSTFLACFDLIMSGIFFNYVVLWNMFIWSIFNSSLPLCFIFHHVLAPFRGSCCVKMAQND